MKKLYTLAFATAVAVGASATAPQLLTNPTKANAAPQPQLSQIEATVNHSASIIKSRAGEDSSIEGNYTVTIGDFYYQGGAGEINIQANITDNGDGTITIDSGYFLFAITTAYDASTNDITFASTKLGEQTTPYGNYYVEFAPGFWDEELGNVIPTDYTVKYDDGVIAFPVDHNFSWKAYNDENYSDLAGYLDLFDVMKFIKLEEEEPIDEEQAGQWEDVGLATFVDSWILASYSDEAGFINPNNYPYEVTLQKNIENPNVYRLWKPYQTESFPIFEDNTSKYQGQIVFDISDPDHVIFRPGYPAGFANSNGEFYNFDILGWQIYMAGDAYDEEYYQVIIDYMEEKGQPFSTFKDGVVTVNRSVFDIDANCTKAYSWSNVTSYVSTITFPEETAIETIGTETDAPVYYNMQGVRLENPAEGFAIRVQGDKATKVLIK